MAKKRNRQPQQKADLGALGLGLAAIVLGGLSFFLQDAIGVSYGVYGVIIWVTALLLAFMFGLLYFSQFILSLRGSEGWSGGLSLLWRFYGRQADLYIENVSQPKPKRARRRKQAEAPISDPDELPASFKDVKAGMVRSHQCLSLGKKGTFQRAGGPGFVMLYPGESITQVVDLRPHVRQQNVKATTRDGIPVNTEVFVSFQVRQEEEAAPELAFPYDKNAIFQVSYANTIDKSAQMMPWTEQLTPRAAALLVMELARYTLDDLFQIDDAHAMPLEDIKATIKRQLERDAVAQGVTIHSVSFGRLHLPEDVMRQRIKTWQARWEKEIQVRRAAGDAEAVRRIKRSRARVQVEIIERITQNIEIMRRAEKTDLADIVMLRMIETLEEAMSDKSVQAMVPDHLMSNMVVDTSSQMRAWIAPPQDGEDVYE